MSRTDCFSEAISDVCESRRILLLMLPDGSVRFLPSLPATAMPPSVAHCIRLVFDLETKGRVKKGRMGMRKGVWKQGAYGKKQRNNDKHVHECTARS